MTCADCEKKAAAVPADSIRNAAALFVSAGKLRGFVEGTQWSAQALASVLDQVLVALPATKRKQLEPHLRALVTQIEQKGVERAVDAGGLEGAARLMVERLEQPSTYAPREPTIPPAPVELEPRDGHVGVLLGVLLGGAYLGILALAWRVFGP